jgi:hypothetical protein
MKFVINSMLTITLMSVFAVSTAFGCGEMTNGTKCLVQTPGTGVETKTDKTAGKTLDIDFPAFLRMIFGSVFR